MAKRGVDVRVAAVAAVLAAVVIGCGSDDAEPEAGGPVKIRMSWGVPAKEIKYLMMERPEVAPNLGKAYEIEWQQFSGNALGVQGLAAGTLDCATVGGLSVANGIDQGADIVILGEFLEERAPYFSTAWMVRKDSGIDSLDDLRGKRVATNAVGGSTDYLQDFHIEEQSGLKAGRDYEKVEVPFGQMQETLLSGRVDMGLFPQPFYGAINATGEVKTTFRLNDEIEPFVQILNGCRRDFVEDNEEAIRKFQADWERVADWMTEPANRDEVVAASAAATKIPAEVLDRFLLTKQDYFRPDRGALTIDALQREWTSSASAAGSTRTSTCATTSSMTSSPIDPKIAARGLGKVYATRRGDVAAIDGLDFSATAGEFVSVVGPPAAGSPPFSRSSAGSSSQRRRGNRGRRADRGTGPGPRHRLPGVRAVFPGRPSSATSPTTSPSAGSRAANCRGRRPWPTARC